MRLSAWIHTIRGVFELEMIHRALDGVDVCDVDTDLRAAVRRIEGHCGRNGL
jgi:hypothetical protein